MIQTEKIEFRKLRDFGELINVTFEFLRQNLKKLGLSILFIVGPLALITGVIGGIYSASKLNSLSSMQLFTFNLPLLFLHYFFILITAHLLVTVTYSYIFLYFERDHENIDVSDVLQKTKEFFFPFLGISIGVFFAVLLGMLLFVIPGIYLAITLSTIYAVKMIEGHGFFDSFERCRHLIRNNWWFTFGLILIFAVIQYFFSFILQIPMAIVNFVGMMHSVSKGAAGVRVSEFYVVISSLVYMISFFFYTIGIIGITFHYFNLVEQKEARGLMQKLNNINATDNIS